jgi:predicted nucleic acid-binding protein
MHDWRDLIAANAKRFSWREHADLLLMDEKLGVRIAREQGLAVTGTLGVLLQATKHGLVDMEQALTELQGTDFRCSRRVIEEVRRLARASSDD